MIGAHDARPRAHLHGIPAVPRFRRHARAAMRSRVFDRVERKFDVHRRSSAPHLMLVSSNVSPAASLSTAIASLMTFASSASAPERRGLRIALRGAAVGAARVRSPRRVAIVRRGESSGDRHGARRVQFAGARQSLRESSRRSTSPRSFTCRSRMRRASPWTRSPGAGIFAACRGRANCRWWSSWHAQAPGYDGILSLEIFNDRFRAGSDGDDRSRWHALTRLSCSSRWSGASASRRRAARRADRLPAVWNSSNSAPAKKKSRQLGADVAHAGVRSHASSRSQGTSRAGGRATSTSS